MRFCIQVQAILACVSVLAEASYTRCYTREATTSLKGACPTRSSTISTSCTSYFKTTVTTVTTPPPTTLTKVSSTTTTVTAATSTQTATSTITATSTTTNVVSTTVTNTVTTTVTVNPTTTYSSTPDFLPVDDTLVGASYNGNAGSIQPQKRSARRRAARNDQSPAEKRDSKSKKWYPTAVNCYKWTPSAKCSSSTTTIKVTSTAPKSTATVTSTAKFTTTTYPAASTTITTGTTTTLTATSTSIITTTTTSTETVMGPASTVYPQCATDNFANLWSGSQPQYSSEQSGANDDGSFTGVGASSAYDCCLAALLDPTGPAEIFAFYPDYSNCVFFEATTQCASQNDHQWTIVTDQSDGSTNLIYGNSACGRYTAGQYNGPSGGGGDDD